jgi:hypothetical protein
VSDVAFAPRRLASRGELSLEEIERLVRVQGKAADESKCRSPKGIVAALATHAGRQMSEVGRSALKSSIAVGSL